MASPFHYFRKHQKTFLVAAAVVAMFVFVLGDALMGFLRRAAGGGGGRSATSTVVSWDGGSLNVQELDILTSRRYFISEFLRKLQMIGAQRIQADGGTPQSPNVPNFTLPEGVGRRNVQLNVVTTRILAELATQAGMKVSDEVINHFLHETSLRRVEDREIISLLGSQGRGDLRTNEDRLFSGLRELLLGEYYLSSFGSALRTVTPEQRWEDWRRINHQIALEAAILPVDQFVSQTPEPSESDLQQLYDQYKNDVGGIPRQVLGKQLPSPDPGFRQPRRVRLQYLLGDINVWTDNLLGTITEKEIADYYERNKRTQFVRSNTTTTEASPEQTPEQGGDSDNAKPEEPAEKEADKKEAAPDVKPQKPTEKNGGEESKAQDAEAGESAEPPPTDETSRTPRQRRFRLVALEDDGQKPAENETTENGSPSTSESDNAKTDAPPENSNAKQEDNKQEDNKKQDNKKQDAKKQDTKAQTTEEKKEKAVEYEPLADVSDQIRRLLARDKAVVQLKRVMERAYAELQTEYNRYGALVVAAQSEGREPPKPPAKLADLAERARQSKLSFEKTDLLSQMELGETYVGKAVDAQSGRQLVVQTVFADLEPYEPLLAQDRLDGNWYLLIKVEDVPSRVPKLEEIRTEVVTAWKKREAGKLALAKAEQLAQEAQEAAGSLADFFAEKGYEVVTTDLFSWLTFGSTPMEMRRGPQLGEAPPLTAVGPDFMSQAFKLQPNQVVGLLNYDQSNAYVIRLDRRARTEDELRAAFLSEANNWFGGQIMMNARWQRAQRKLMAQLTDRIGLNLEKLEDYFREQDQR